MGRELGHSQLDDGRLRVLNPLWSDQTKFARECISMAAFSDGPSLSSVVFEPALKVLNRGGRFLAVPGLQATVLYFDGAGDGREVSFGISGPSASTCGTSTRAAN